MADKIREFLDYAGLGIYDENIKAHVAAQSDAAKEAAIAAAKEYSDGLADNYDAAGTAATKVQELAEGAVAQNASDIKANADAIAAINNEETGLLKQAKDYTDGELDKAIGIDLGTGEGQFADVKAYVDKKTEGIATDAALGELQATVEGNTDKIGALETAVNVTAPATYQTKTDAQSEHQALTEAINAKVASVAAGDASVNVTGDATAPKVAVKLSADGSNALELAEDGLKVVIPAAAEYTIEKSADSGDYAAVYALKKDGVQVGASINIPKDMVVSEGSVVENPDGQPAGTYIKLVLQNVEEPLYINVGSLIEYVTSGSGETDAIVINVSDDHKVTAVVREKSITKAMLADAVATELNKAHTHNFSDEDALNGITAAKIAAWDAAQANAEATAAGALASAKTELEGKITTEAERAAAAEKVNSDAIAAINDAETGLLKQAKDYTDSEVAKEAARAAAAEEKALTDAKAYTDQRVGGVDLTGIATNAAAIEELKGRADGHDTAIGNLEAADQGFETRIAANEEAKADHESRIAAVEADLNSFVAIPESKITALFA